MVPGGRFSYLAHPYCRGYAVDDGQPLFGVPRRGYNVTYAFDALNTLRGISFDSPPERREELFGVLYSTVGAPAKVAEYPRTRYSQWASDGGVTLSIQETRASRFPLIWVSFHASMERKNNQSASSQHRT
jgi:hypothetical protein